MKAPFPTPIQNWHNDTYADIDPSRPELSVEGKKVIVTGGGAGIGRGTVEAFAIAGASTIVITGRRSGPLGETKKYIESKFSNVSVSTFSADITDAEGMKKVAAEVGGWDILVNNAGYLAKPGLALDSDLNEWWKGYEINIKGTLIVAQAFFPTRNADAIFVGTATAAVSLPTDITKGQTSYVPSKLGLIKFLEILAAEYPDIRIMIIHPGVVDTDMMEKGGMRNQLPLDSVELPSHFTVWVVSSEAEFLRGRMVSCNWDVNELQERKDKFAGSNIFQSELHGYGGPDWQF